MKFTMKNIFRDIEENFQEKELVTALVLTGAFLFLAFLGHTRFTTIALVDEHGVTWTIHVSYYGYPYEMIRILNPIGGEQAYGALFAGAGLIQLLWSGLVLDFALYFLLAFAIVYLVKKLRR
jgi:predicted small integral membrane protein